MKLLSYKNDAKLKKDFIREIKKHRTQDMILQGTYGEKNGTWKGCAVSCSLRSLAILDGEELKTTYDNHALYETKLGIPEWLARLEDTIFEGLPKKEAKLWPEQFANAIPVGVNLDPVKWKFCAFILKKNIERVLALKISDDLKKQVVDAIRGVLSVHEHAITTGVWDENAAESAERSAWSAWSAAESARSAAWSAWSAAKSAWSAAKSARSAMESAWSAAESARSAAKSARSAAESARSAAKSARSAAWSAWSAAKSAWSAAESAAYKKYAKELLRLLKGAND